jgi:hypothetical protein
VDRFFDRLLGNQTALDEARGFVQHQLRYKDLEP